VQLGPNPSPTLIHFSIIAQNELGQARLVLITNIPAAWKDFPGHVIDCSLFPRNESIAKLTKRFPEREQISGSYWVYTIERLFVLEILGNFYPPEVPILHLESDCYSLIDSAIYSEMQLRCTKVAVPRHSQTQGIASVLFAPNLNSLNVTLKQFETVINKSKIWLGDMNLLGIGLNAGLLNELPTQLTEAWEIKTSGIPGDLQKFIFDGAAIGQYLLGQDPYHTNGYAVPGHVNEFFPDEINKWRWSISQISRGQKANLFAENAGARYRVANIHVHSKILLHPLENANPMWKTIIDTANGACQPVPMKMPDNKIHTGPISMINKFRFARRNGMKHMLHQLSIRMISRVKSF
jgi:hypothetical protein